PAKRVRPHPWHRRHRVNATGHRSLISPLMAGFAAGVIIALVVGIMATINLTYGAPWSQTFTLTAAVSDADAMSVGSDVRIGGRLVGQVVSVTAHGNYTNVVFHVDNSNWPLPSDTTASVRLATLLGQKYLQLNPGHRSDPMANNATIGLRATKPVVDFDQILNTFDKPTRDALTSLIRTGAAAVQGLGKGYASKLDAGLKQLGTFTSQLNTMLATLIPQTTSFMTAPSPATGDTKVTSDAARELIYEIGSATSQSNYVGAAGNYFLRQQAVGVDPCGLVPVHCGLPANSQQSGSGTSGLLPPLPKLPPLPTVPPVPTVP